MKMSEPSPSVVSYQGREQKLMKRLVGTEYNVPDIKKWGILDNGLLEVYKPTILLKDM